MPLMIFPPLITAIRTQDPKMIGKSVKAAVISLIILNASLAAAFAEQEHILFGEIEINLLTIVHIYGLIGCQSYRHALKIYVNDLIVALILRVENLS